VRAIRREPPDLRKLSRALVRMALAEAEAEAAAEQDAKTRASKVHPQDSDDAGDRDHA
jgi:hypothetical protein